MSTDVVDPPDEASSTASMKGIDLLDGEQVLRNELPSKVNWWKALTLAAILVLLALLILLDGDFGTAFVFLLLAGLVGVYVRYARRRSRYIVTNHRVKKSVGLLRKTTGETLISDIRGLSTEQSFFERLVGTGSILIDSGAAAGKLGIQGVQNHRELANTIRAQQRRIEESKSSA